MAGLLSILQTSGQALRAYTGAMNTIQQNLVNSSTPGYARQTPILSDLPFRSNGAFPGGVRFAGTQDSRDPAIEQTVRYQTSQSSRWKAVADQLQLVSRYLDAGDSKNLSSLLRSLFTMPSSWGGGVPSNEQKQEFFNQAGLFASTFSDVARQLESLRDANGDRIAATISQINGLTKGIADSTASGALGEAQLTSSLQQLSELVDVTVTANADGTVGVLMGGQVPLVSAGKAYSLAVGPPAAGNTVHVFDSDGKDVTTVISDGTLGGLLSLQNVEFPGLLGDLKSTGALNTLASKIAFSVNPAFSPLGLFSIDLKNPKNSAASLQLNSALDPSTYQFTATRTSKLIALGASTAGDPALNGLGFADYYESIVTGTSLQASDAKVFSDRHSTLLEQASELRDRVSGVDTNTEAVELLQIQQGYLAITKVMSSVNELLASLMNLVS